MEKDQVIKSTMASEQPTTSTTDNTDDECDCEVQACPGCFYPCKTCESTKCGHICRTNRIFDKYDKWEIKYKIFQKPKTETKQTENKLIKETEPEPEDCNFKSM